MSEKILALGLGVAAILLGAGALKAQDQGENCAPHASVVMQLAEKYGEMRQSIGLAQNNQLVEVFASLQTGSWTIIVTRPTGIACMVAAGENFELVNGGLGPALPGDPA